MIVLIHKEVVEIPGCDILDHKLYQNHLNRFIKESYSTH